jgi:hypothetical protein
MPAPSFLTFEGGTGPDGTELPRRPSTDDLGGDAKQDNNDYPPDDVEHFTAAGWNQLVKVAQALSKTAAACKLEVRFTGSTPYIARAPALSANVTIATFTVLDNGIGDTTITWPANTFPSSACSPTGLTLLVTTSADRAADVEEVANGIRVRTKAGGAAADIAWTIDLN